MTKRSTDEQATVIFGKIPQIVAKNNGFVIVHFYDGSRVIGMYADAYQQINTAIPSTGELVLKNATGSLIKYSLYLISNID